MDWVLARDHNHNALLRVAVALFAWVGLAESGALVARLPKDLYRRVLSVLRPAESALRRLIVVAARGVALPCLEPTLPLATPVQAARKTGRIAAFPLFDRRINPERGRSRGAAPRIRSFDEPTAPPDIAPRSDGRVDTQALCRRLRRLRHALDTLPAQVQRLLRWRARHAKSIKRPMRPGRPPGHRDKPIHGIDTILRNLQELALWAYVPDTS